MKLFKQIAVIAFIALTAFIFTASHTFTPKFKDTGGKVLENSISEERMALLGNTLQYVLIRGQDRTAPVLIFLHGGPGTSAMAFNRIYNSTLEENFVFVNWDQRGTGYSFDKSAPPSSLTLARITQDLDELIELLKPEFNADKVLLVGHSWGSMLGLNYISKYPEKVAAYIGIGQMAFTERSENEVYGWAIDQAVARNDKKALELLKSIGSPPYDSASEMMTHRSIVAKYGGAWVEPKPDIAYALDVIRAPEFSWFGLRNLLRGGNISLNALFPTFSGLNAFEDYPILTVPIFFMEGRHDKVVSPKQAEAYLNAVKAPYKELIWFENSAHSPQWEEPENFNREVLKVARKIGLFD